MERINPLVTSIVLNWRRADMTIGCVRRLMQSDYPNHHIIVVDNGSDDDSFSQMQQALPNVTVVESESNVGFSAGCNIGIRIAIAAGSDYIALVNNDLHLDEGSVTAAVSSLEHHSGHGCVTGKIYSDSPPTLWQVGGHIDHWRVMGIAHGLGETDSGQFDVPGTTEWASGAMTVFRSSVLQEIGLIPEEYFFGQEEWDFSTNIRKHGYTIGYEPNYVGTHSSGSSYKTNPALNSYGSVRNRHLYAEKYLPRWHYLLWRLAFLVHLYLKMAAKLRRRKTHEQVSVHVRAMQLGWRRHRRGEPVTLAELTAVNHELGLPSSWAPIDSL